MRIDLEVSLDPTLGCGQAHRWRKSEDGTWEGVWRDSVVRMRQLGPGSVEVTGTDDRSGITRYLGGDDDLDEIMRGISGCDGYVAKLAEHCPGMRILRQDHWECLATYLLATNANVARIGKMVESVCDHFGKDLGGRHAFPTPSQILDGCGCIGECRLGFREQRFVTLAERVESGDLDVESFSEMGYDECVRELQGINGVGPKVADCVALFAFEHMEAFPVDARISKVMEDVYGVTGSYKTVSGYGREKFGRYAGYAQEFLYHADFIPF
jgi:N-glycosylase/DNA lyase